MGVDLSLLPFELDSNASFSLLWLTRRRELWEPISKIEKRFGREVPAGFASYVGKNSHGESTYGLTSETPYGESLKFVPASTLASLADAIGVADDPFNRAVWAFLCALPPDMNIALYWH